MRCNTRWVHPTAKITQTVADSGMLSACREQAAACNMWSDQVARSCFVLLLCTLSTIRWNAIGTFLPCHKVQGPLASLPSCYPLLSLKGKDALGAAGSPASAEDPNVVCIWVGGDSPDKMMSAMFQHANNCTVLAHMQATRSCWHPTPLVCAMTCGCCPVASTTTPWPL